MKVIKCIFISLFLGVFSVSGIASVCTPWVEGAKACYDFPASDHTESAPDFPVESYFDGSGMKTNAGHPNGCGSGSTLAITKSSADLCHDLNNVCDYHDHCYASCGAVKSRCDDALVNAGAALVRYNKNYGYMGLCSVDFLLGLAALDFDSKQFKKGWHHAQSDSGCS